MTDFDKTILNQMLSFGFKHHCTDSDSSATIYEYKYGPEYLQGNHYHLKIYAYHMKSRPSDYQLSIHDRDNRNVEIVYRYATISVWQRNALIDHNNELFQAEIRMITIKNIINE